MADEYFVLQADRDLEPGQPAYSIPGLKNALMANMLMLSATLVSVKNRRLEWLIPNNQYNQGWISQNYSHFKVLKAGKEAKLVKDIKPMEGLPDAPAEGETEKKIEDAAASENTSEETPAVEGGINSAPGADTPAAQTPAEAPTEEAPAKTPGEKVIDYFATPATPEETKQLKSGISGKLTELGVEVPKNSTLSTLQDLLKQQLGG